MADGGAYQRLAELTRQRAGLPCRRF